MNKSNKPYSTKSYNDRKKWIDMMRSSIQTSVDFTAHRMIKQYWKHFYQIKEKEAYNSIK